MGEREENGLIKKQTNKQKQTTSKVSLKLFSRKYVFIIEF